MMPHVFSVGRKDLKIVWMVVSGVIISVVDFLFGQKIATKDPLHHKPMLAYIAALAGIRVPMHHHEDVPLALCPLTAFPEIIFRERRTASSFRAQSKRAQCALYHRQRHEQLFGDIGLRQMRFVHQPPQKIKV